MKKSKTVRAKNLVDIELEKVHAVKIENIVNLVGDFPRIEKVELVTTVTCHSTNSKLPACFIVNIVTFIYLFWDLVCGVSSFSCL